MLFVKSWARDAASMPIFFEKDEILGRVEVDLDKAESFKGITITVSFGDALSNKILRVLSRFKEVPPLLVKKNTFSSRRRKLYGSQLQKMVPS